MTAYRAPIQDMRFVLYEVQEVESFLAGMPATADVNAELMDAVLEAAAQLAQEVLAPLNRSGDEEGCRLETAGVMTPKGFKAAYETFAQGGWVGLSGDPAYGGQGMPKVLGVLVEEMIMAANTAFALYPVLSAGASLLLARHGSEALKQLYLPKLYSGEWSATMCLTEAHAGTDLGLIRTRAEPVENGAYRINGSKIFITGGDHDLSDNIIHLVLARLPGAPAGPKGISLFLVPKYLPNHEGGNGVRNTLTCSAIESKMGIKASATCVMNFDAATGFLVGEPHSGLACMFTMMNYERLSIGLQGIGLADNSYQVAVAYARERVQGRAAQGALAPDELADPIIVHPDVRRMLLTVRGDVEAGRALAVYVASQLDQAYFHPDEARRKRAALLVAVLTPVAKAAFSDRGFESCVLAQQVLGGHGYIREWGLEQNVRDARIAQIYEGTNGIQALDLVGRKLVRDREGMLQVLIDEIRCFIDSSSESDIGNPCLQALEGALSLLESTTAWLIAAAGRNVDEVGAASVAYLRLLSLVLYAFMWGRMANAALKGLTAGKGDSRFYEAKLTTAKFFVSRILPGSKSLAEEIKAGCESLMTLPADQF
jgi:alkylation response protein AidB-like acyl-CoA dehydrogenase